MLLHSLFFFFFFFNDTATTEIYTLSLHDALPIFSGRVDSNEIASRLFRRRTVACSRQFRHSRSEEHTSELQSRPHLVCRLLLEKKKNLNVWPTRGTKTRRGIVLILCLAATRSFMA